MGPSYIADFNAGRRLYCGECKKSTLNPKAEMEIMSSASGYSYYQYTYDNRYNVTKTLKCSHCGTVHTMKKENVTALPATGFTSKFSHGFVFDRDEDKVVLKLVYKIIKVYGERLSIQMKNRRVVVNTKTGYSYELPMATEGRKPRKKTIKNITYGFGVSINTLEIDKTLMKKFQVAIYEKLKKKYGESIVPIEQHYFVDMLKGQFDGEYNLQRLMMYNRFPYLKPDMVETLHQYYRSSRITPRADMKLRRVDRLNIDPMPELLKSFKVKDVDFDTINAVMKNPIVLYRYNVLQKAFKNHENILRLANPDDRDFYKLNFSYKEGLMYIRIFKDIIAQNGEEKAVDIISGLLSSSLGYFATKYSYIKKLTNQQIDLTGDYKDIFDRIKAAARTIYEEEVSIKDSFSVSRTIDTEESELVPSIFPF